MLSFIYEMEKCIGCKACQVACKDKNHLENAIFYRKVETFEHKEKFLHFSGGCNHCEKASCIEACPTEAMHKDTDSTVAHDAGKCIGCGACTWNCPYGAVSLSKKNGLAQKCNTCKDLRIRGQKPACVKACLTYCLDFGKIDNIARNDLPEFLAPSEKTEPVLIIKK